LDSSLIDTDIPVGTKKHIFSLEEAIDIAMSWPPPQKWEKPEPPVLERNANVIMENLSNRTMVVVNLNAPHILLCIQGKWPVNIFYLISHLRMPSLSSMSSLLL